MKINFSGKHEEVIHKFNKGKINHLLLHGSVGSGKTFLLVFIFLMQVNNNKNRNFKYIIAGASRSTIIRNFLDPMEEMLGKEIKVDKYGKFSLFGNDIYIFEGKNRDSFKKLRGMNSAGSLLGELTTLDKNFVEEVIDRTRVNTAFILSDTNPDLSTHWVKLNYVDKSGEKLANGKINVEAIKFTVEDNEHLPQDYVLRLKARYPIGSCLHERKIMGNWVDETEASIYSLYMQNIVRLKEVEINNLYVALDLGIADGTVLTFATKKKIDNEEVVIVLHCYQSSGKATEHYINYIKDFCSQNKFNYKDIQVILPHDSAKREDNITSLVTRYMTYVRIFPRTLKLAPIGQIDVINSTRYNLFNHLTNKSRVYFLENESVDNLIRKLLAYSWTIRTDGSIDERTPDHGTNSAAPSNYADSFEYLLIYTLGLTDIEKSEKEYYKFLNSDINKSSY